MGYWFNSGACNAKEEFDAVKKRDKEAWALMVTRLAAIQQEPHIALEQDAIGTERSLGFFRSKNEAMVYRLEGSPATPQVIIAGMTRSAADEGLLIHQALERTGKAK